MKLTVTASGLPPGSYKAKLVKVEPTEHAEYGPGLRWAFAVADGPHADRLAARTTGCYPTAQNALGRMLAGMLGRPLTVDDEVDVDDLIGREFVIAVEATENGGTRIGRVERRAAE